MGRFFYVPFHTYELVLCPHQYAELISDNIIILLIYTTLLLGGAN